LMGDQQFAGLGLVLLGVVADVGGLVGECEKREGKTEEQVEGEVASRGGREGESGSVVSTPRRTKLGSDNTLNDSVGEDLGQVVQRATTTATATAAGHDIRSELADESDEEANAPIPEDEMMDDSFDGFSSPPHAAAASSMPASPMTPRKPNWPGAGVEDVVSEEDEQQEDAAVEHPSANEAGAVRMGRSAELAKEPRSTITKQSATRRQAQSNLEDWEKQTVKKKQKKKEKRRNAIDDLFAGLA
jgi:hypothetical protein